MEVDSTKPPLLENLDGYILKTCAQQQVQWVATNLEILSNKAILGRMGECSI